MSGCSRYKEKTFLVFAIVIFSHFCLADTETSNSNSPEVVRETLRNGKLFPIIQLVRFQNLPCHTDSSSGTCYLQKECDDRGGKVSGSCAKGYGVCCVFERTCGDSSRENCTLFKTPDYADTDNGCKLEICPCTDHICQLRLDFNSFVISGPSTSTETVTMVIGNTPLVNSPAVPSTNYGQCLTDSFSITSPGNPTPPVVCGTLSGEHMYVDASDLCHHLSFTFHPKADDTDLVRRDWHIKVTQYSCSYNNLAPPGCTQYFFDSEEGVVQSFNYHQAQLADQNQNICVRRERGNCRICWTAVEEESVDISGVEDLGIADSDTCCAYNAEGLTKGFDCLTIHHAVKDADEDEDTLENSRFCGQNQGLVTEDGEDQVICSLGTPFSVRFRSDRFETAGEALTANKGFRLHYAMDSSGCKDEFDSNKNLMSLKKNKNKKNKLNKNKNKNKNKDKDDEDDDDDDMDDMDDDDMDDDDGSDTGMTRRRRRRRKNRNRFMAKRKRNRHRNKKRNKSRLMNRKKNKNKNGKRPKNNSIRKRQRQRNRRNRNKLRRRRNKNKKNKSKSKNKLRKRNKRKNKVKKSKSKAKRRNRNKSKNRRNKTKKRNKRKNKGKKRNKRKNRNRNRNRKKNNRKRSKSKNRKRAKSKTRAKKRDNNKRKKSNSRKNKTEKNDNAKTANIKVESREIPFLQPDMTPAIAA